MCNGIPAETSAGFGHVHQVEFLQLCGNHIGWYERGQQRCETKPGQYTTCYRYTGDTRTNNIAHTQVFRCNFTTQAGSGQVLAGSAAHPHWSLGDKMEYFLEHGIAEGEAQALIGRLGEIAALVAGNQYLCAGSTFRVGQRVVLFHNQRPPERNHQSALREYRRR
jgi:hypothetical protein